MTRIARNSPTLPCLARRRALVGAGAATLLSRPLRALAQSAPRPLPLTRRIPSSAEPIPAIGLGSWITFNVGNDALLREQCNHVMQAFFEAGGRMIDSSPMYGSSQDVIGAGLARLGRTANVFSADKVWIGDGTRGVEQIEQSRRKWQVARFDLLQVHNLLAWKEHLPTLLAMKAEGRLRYVGITTSEGRRHGEFEQIMRTQPLDFVQLSYNLLDRAAEERLLPLAESRGIAVIVNRPFRQGDLTRTLARSPLPGWAAEIGCRTWAQALLKYILAHPAVTCAIPATSVPAHARDNVAAARDPLPDAAMRRRMVADVSRLT